VRRRPPRRPRPRDPAAAGHGGEQKARDRPGKRDPVRDDAVVEIDERHGHERGDEREVRGRGRGRAEAHEHESEERAGDQLHGGVAPRDARAAAAAPASEQREGEDRDVVPPWIGLRHFGQADPGRTTESPRGMR